MPRPQQNAVSATERARELAYRCKHPEAKGDGWLCLCPSHNDHHPSLSIDVRGEKVLVRCRARCDTRDVMAALGLTMAYLSVESRPSTNGHKPIRAIYPYVDAQGHLLYEKVRLETEVKEERFKIRRPDPVTPGAYLWGRGGVEAVLYNLPAVLQAVATGQTIHISEGEHDARTLIDAGYVATTGPDGGGTWRDSFTTILTGAHVILWPDNDDAGAKAVAKVRAQLTGHVQSLRTVQVPTQYKDVAEWVEAGATQADLEAVILDAAVGAQGLSSLSSLSSQSAENSPEPVFASEEELNSLFSLNSQPNLSLRDEAFYGVAGELVRRISPETEADPAALLLQFLVYFGVVVGRQPYYLVGATRHYPNLFAVLVGATGKARKGTAYDYIDAVMRTVDASWARDNIISGCGSGEGLIHAVRDPVIKREPIKVKGKVTGAEDVMTDPGVLDKRLLVQESEFASVLKVANREGNILSMTLRQAWDSGTLRNTVKTSPQRATNAHIALLGHITAEELQKLLTTVECANGFGNRFLWIAVQRSKLLPDGGDLARLDMQAVVTKLRKACEASKYVGQMHRDAAATQAWKTIYKPLTADQPGLTGHILARGEPQVLRLSMLYALLDCAATIRVEHLTAALAVWEYAEASVQKVFGASTGHREADTLREALKWAEAGTMTKTDIIREVFHGHIKAHDLNTAIRLLVQEGVVTRQFAPSTGGRRKEYICYGASPSRSPLPRARAGYIDLIGLKEHPVASGDIPTEGCELSEKSEESPFAGANPYDGQNHPHCEESEKSEESLFAGVDAHPDCLPPPCPHAETQAEGMLDGSAMIRCTACRRIVQVTAPARG